ncbi:MAG: hypothetical protein FWF94_01930 [Oscillospiraceae bacterium]|nr:hypothetical protein [Oscillospiraceae bacterium]
MYKGYLKAQSITNQVAFRMENSDELRRFSLSDYRWANEKLLNNSNISLVKGEVCLFDFGKNHFPEMSYEHKGLVVGLGKCLLYVLPICSYRDDKEPHRNAYCENNKNEDSDFWLLKCDDFDFITHDSVLSLRDLRTISSKRFIKKYNTSIDINGIMFKTIERIIFKNYFYDFYCSFNGLNKDNIKLKNVIDNTNRQNTNLKNKNTILYDKLEIVIEENIRLKQTIKQHEDEIKLLKSKELITSDK